MTDRNIEGRVDLLEYRMDKAERAGAEYRASLKELSETLSKLTLNINQVKWIVLGAALASQGPAGFAMVSKIVGF